MPRRHLILAFLCWLAVGAFSFAFAGTALATGLRGGWLVAGLAGVCTFAFLAWAADRPLASVLRATVIGFLIRFALLALGLVVTARVGGTPGAYCVGFFAVYLPLQVIEVAALVGRTKVAEARS
ncbi:MAG TPA: hypothetical protein VMB50_18395 [Myxococcales bacterium]|nr:hypothetical protein [Myxococcales bacterium]